VRRYAGRGKSGRGICGVVGWLGRKGERSR